MTITEFEAAVFAQKPTGQQHYDEKYWLGEWRAGDVICREVKDMRRLMFVLEGCRSRPDLEEPMDWGRKGRVLVREKVHLPR